MDKEFSKRIKEYLDSECSDYGLEYKWEWCEDTANCEVEITKDYIPEKSAFLNFRYDKENDDLSIELSEDSFYETREFDHTVKYFWMLVSPVLFAQSR